MLSHHPLGPGLAGSAEQVHVPSHTFTPHALTLKHGHHMPRDPHPHAVLLEHMRIALHIGIHTHHICMYITMYQ